MSERNRSSDKVTTRKASRKLSKIKKSRSSKSKLSEENIARRERARERREQKKEEDTEAEDDESPPPAPDQETLLRVYFDGDSVHSLDSDDEDVMDEGQTPNDDLSRLFLGLIERKPTGPAFTVLLSGNHSDYYEIGPVRERWLADLAFFQDTNMTMKVAAPGLVKLMNQYENLLQEMLNCHTEEQMDLIREKRKQDLERKKALKEELLANAAQGDSQQESSNRESSRFERLRRMSVSRTLKRLSRGMRNSRASSLSTVSATGLEYDIDLEEHLRDLNEHRELVRLWLLLVQELVELGVDVNSTYVGSTLLDVLCSWEPASHHPEVTGTVEWLLEHGADVEGGKSSGIVKQSPLVCAISRGLNKEALVLINHGADVTVKDADGSTVKELARPVSLLRKAIGSSEARVSFSGYESE